MDSYRPVIERQRRQLFEASRARQLKARARRVVDDLLREIEIRDELAAVGRQLRGEKTPRRRCHRASGGGLQTAARMNVSAARDKRRQEGHDRGQAHSCCPHHTSVANDTHLSPPFSARALRAGSTCREGSARTPAPATRHALSYSVTGRSAAAIYPRVCPLLSSLAHGARRIAPFSTLRLADSLATINSSVIQPRFRSPTSIITRLRQGSQWKPRRRARSLPRSGRRRAHDRVRHYGGPACGVSKGSALPAQAAG